MNADSTSVEENNLAVACDCLAALEASVSGESLRRFYADNARQIELPNRLNPAGQESDLADILKRSEQGLKVLVKQRYEVTAAIGNGDCVA